MKTEQLNQTLTQFWGERSQREKMLLGWGGAVLAVAIAYSVLWSPAQEGRARIQRELPTMRRELAQMTAQANEA
ncbi:type II secretion system protein GspM, partial [Burkholderia sp. RS02]